jgi:2-methylcitrate dehydratase PrpD
MPSAKTTLETAITDFVLNFSGANLSSKARDRLRLLMKDQLALQIGSSLLPWSQECRSFALGRSRAGMSTIAADTTKVDASSAAFLNAVYGHAFEYDDILSGSSAHPGCCVVPTALAIGEEVGASLDEVLVAIATGYEVYTRIGILAAPTLIQRGWHPHCILANFGAAAIAAKLWKLSPVQTFHALSIASSHASGTTEYTSTGGSIKRVHSGMGVQSGIQSAEMARAGITGSELYLTGNKGFFKTFIQRDAAADALEAFSLEAPLELEGVWIKPYCCCGANHAPIDGMSLFRNRVSEIRQVEVAIQPKSNKVVGNYNSHIYGPRSITELQYALPVQMSLSLLNKGNGYKTHRAYVDGKLDLSPSSEIIALAKKIKIVERPELDQKFIKKWVADMTVSFENGTSEKVFVENSRGTPDSPLTEDEFNVKFDELTFEVIGQQAARALTAAIDDQELAGPITSITSWMIPQSSANESKRGRDLAQ